MKTTKNPYVLMEALIDYLAPKGLFYDVYIYVENNRYLSTPLRGSSTTELQTSKGTVYYQEDGTFNVRDYVEYSNPNTLTLTFEGPLYHALNYGTGKVDEQIDKIAERYGLYWEFGYAYSLSFYEL